MCPGGIFGFLASLILSLSPLVPGAAVEGCVAMSAGSCTYVATHVGGYEAAGDWSIEITRGGSTMSYRGQVGVQVTNAIQPGDRVMASVGGGGGFVRVGSNG